ncbi:lipopolysaccharide biosynthesis protein [Oleispirillum naphthae]|uniref:lipopolysaccharide biosynthesis protein n=1 Tax=Oleispirillum naphthae TaxID=2838853 RepID=UPI0030822F17
MEMQKTKEMVQIPATPGRASGMVRGAGAALLVRGVEVGGKFVLYFAVARLLGGEESGFFFLCLTWAHVLSTLTRMGLDRALIRHVSAELAVGQGTSAARCIREGVAGSGLLACAVAALCWAGAGLLETHVFSMPGLAPALRMAALAIPPQALCVVLCAALVGLGRPVVSQFLQNAWWPLVLLALVAAGCRSAADLLAGFAAAGASAGLLCLGLIARERRRLRADAVPAADTPPLPPLRSTALPLAVVEVVQVSISNMPVLVLGAFVSPVAVAAFSVANRITQLVWVVLISFGTIAAPRIGAAHRLRDDATLKSLNRTLQVLGALFGGVGAVLMALLAPYLLGFVGSGYEIAAAALAVMAAGQFLNALFTGQDVVLAMTGHGRILRRINLMQFIVCLAASIALIPRIQMIGAAIASAVPLALGCTASVMAVAWLLPRSAPLGPRLPARYARRLFGRAPGTDET